MNRPTRTDSQAWARRAYAALSNLKLLPLLSVTAISLLATPFAQALPDDQNQPIHIESNRAQRDGQKGLMIYEGDVRLRQGSLKIRAEKLTVHTDTTNQVQRVVAEGGPAYFEQQPEAGDAPIAAEANTIDYHVSEEQLKLITNAWLEQGTATMSGNRIDYNMATELLNAEGDSESDRPRIEMVLPPQNQSSPQD
ncbi:lipopolysaccharide transport periplasmic protein LptA [Marinimicrobium sp. ARAG 43.8]|uniref:lipopolysaccharide transport periplasmic protein LptA n=1 Tax=Marinimicrobium sp. ARAG 43.8 TaxID=3418719 RepID=UPI003CF378FA